MPYVKRIVCLANSFKIGGSCIAGKEVLPNGRYGGWIRPNSDRQTAEVRPSECRYEDSTYPKLLDIMDVPILRTAAHDHQTENQIIDSTLPWRKVDELPWASLAQLRDRPATLWINNHHTETRDGVYNCLTPAEAATQTYSLVLIRPENFCVSVTSKTWDGETKRKYMAKFRYNGEFYVLSVTDPVVTAVFKTKSAGEHLLENVDICVSLTEPNTKENVPRCYKLVAAIFNQTPLR